jgi:pilus assembly protein FimV
MEIKIMKYNLAFMVALALAGAASNCFALGLGDIELHSGLGEKLAADIPLIGVRGDDLSSATVTLASNADFKHAGLDRADILSALRFKIVRDADGKPIVRVSSDRAINEPFLDFLVTANWASASLMREYTVLLDPPQFGSSVADSAPAATAGASTSSPTTVAHGTVVQIANPVKPASRPIPVPPGAYGPIKRGETLGEIARRMRPDDSLSVNQMMIALYRANPNAFMGNINSIKAGYGLKSPDPSLLGALNPAEASAEVRRQTQAWRSGQPLTKAVAAAKPATKASAKPSLADGTNQRMGGHLELVAPAAAGSEGAQAGAANSPGRQKPTAAAAGLDVAKLHQQLTASQQQARRAKSRNTGLQNQIDQLKQQLQKTQKLLSIKNGQLASLERQATRQTGSGVFARAGVWLFTPLKLGLLLGALLILAVILAVRRRQREEAALDLAQQPEPGERNLVAGGDSAEPTPAEGFDTEGYQMAEDLAEAKPAAAAEFAVQEMSATEKDGFGKMLSEDKGERHKLSEAIVGGSSVAIDQSDPIADADFHMTYGLYDQAAELVRKALAAEPGRNDLKLKLLEIHFAAGDGEAFVTEANRYQDDLSDENWEEVAAMGRKISPEEAMFKNTGEAVGPAPLEFDITSSEETAISDNEAAPALALEIPGHDHSARRDARVAASDQDEGIDFDIGSLELTSNAAAVGSAVEHAPTKSHLAENSQADLERAISELSAYVNDDALESGDNENQSTSTVLSLDPGDRAAANPDEADDNLGATATKLDLARAYLDMGDADGARDILEEVLDEGTPEQQHEAGGLIKKIA